MHTYMTKLREALHQRCAIHRMTSYDTHVYTIFIASTAIAVLRGSTCKQYATNGLPSSESITAGMSRTVYAITIQATPPSAQFSYRTKRQRQRWGDEKSTHQAARTTPTTLPSPPLTRWPADSRSPRSSILRRDGRGRRSPTLSICWR